ncbi:hypothetical protein ND010_08600 [Neisseria gonorrhoeae]|uniref:hypothetical protein n=1 Tax=Neisseria gonorrhoeae TaxID=485 RepID=UPI0021DA9A43|nr:hypothetical protein [Neisseria gonorrhoeae]UYA63277.1 hypothetical protein ND010_08600 [Neisseria gonorrhoeae]
MAEEMRTCKVCGGNQSRWRKGLMPSRARKGVYYYKSCKTCRNKAVRQKRGKTRGGGKAGAMMTAARLHGYIRAAHAACPILGVVLWTQPAGECA